MREYDELKAELKKIKDVDTLKFEKKTFFLKKNFCLS